MLTDKEILNAINLAPLAQNGTATLIAVGRSIEAAVLSKQELLRQCAASGQMDAGQIHQHVQARELA